ncbi:MAG: secretin N-terminal domain-containing protein [Planctomycetota bacterium]
MSALSTIGSAVRFGGTSEAPRVGEPDGEVEAPQVTIAVDPVSNSLVVVGSPRLAERIAALAAELEAQAPREPVAVRIIDLPDEADARAVSQLVTQTIRQIGRASAGNPGGFTGRVAAAPDPAGGAVIVWANDTDFASLRSLIAATAQPRTGDALTVKVYPMANVTARAAAVAVRDLVSVQPQGRQARRMRRLDLALETPEGPTRASIDPSSVRVTPDPGGVSLIVVAPAEAFTLIDGFIALIDQSPVVDRLAIRRYELNNASAGALANTLQRLFDAQRQGPGARDLPRARFVADDRTNAILVTASGDQHDQVVSLLESADSEQQDGDAVVEIFALAQARPSVLQRVVEQVVIGRDPAKRERVQMSADDGSNLLLVRAPEEDLVEIRTIVNEVEAADTSGLPIRVVTLDRADPEEVAEALRVFLRDRSRAAGAGRRAAPAAITAHRASRTLIVAASDEAFADVQRLIDAMDTQEQAADFVVRIVRLEHAALADLEPMIDDVSQGISTGFQNNWWDSDVRTAREDRIQVSSNPRTNSFVLIGAVEPVEQLQALIETLDQPEDAGVALTARSVRVETGDLESIAAAVRSITVTPGWTWWRGRDPRAVEVRVDARQRQLILIGAPDAIDAAETVIGQLAASEGGPERVVRTLALEHAQAARAARALRQFFSERARAEGLPRDAVSVVGSADGNVLIVAADEASMPLVESLVAELDRPELGDDRSIEVFGVRNADPDRLAGTLRSMFPQRRAEERVIVTAERTGRAVIVSAPNGRLEEIRGLIARLDQAPSEEETRLVTVPLESARASEVAEALRASLPESLRVRITPVGRSNSLLLAGSPEAIETVRGQIEQLDREPTRSLSEVRRIAIEHAVAEDVWFTLSRLLRGRPVRSGDPAPRLDYLPAENALIVSATAEDLEEIDRMVAQLDRPAERERRTEFVGLEFAEAEAAAEALGVFFGRFAQEAVSPEERSVTVVPDPASNSLVISADESVWPRIEGLLSKLDTAEYDTSRQLAVIPLEHADAESVARALNDGFRPTIEESARAERERRSRGDRRESDRRDDSFALPTVLVAEEGAPVVSAEPETNTLIVFAGRRELDRIRTIVGQLDVPEFARSSPRLIALSSGRASVIAESLSAVFARRGDTSGLAVVIRGDDDASALIVRASEDVYAEIAELARALEAEAGKASPSPAVIRVRSASAARMRSIVLASVRPIAERLGEPFVVEADLAGNALVVTASEGIIEEVRRLVSELDGEPVADGGDEAAETGEEADGVRVRSGQSMLVVDLEHQSPAAMGALIERLGVTQAATANGLGLVESAVRVTPLATRTAVALVGQERDVAIIASLVRVLDGEPDASEQAVGLVALRYASADAMANTLRRMLMPTDGSSGSGQGAALAEHVRRLALRLNDVDAAGAAVDLTAPIRLIPDQQTNSLLIASTPANLQIVKSLVQMLDTLPLGDAVLVRIFPLDHAAAVRVRPILIQLFREGEALRRLPGTQRRGLPSTTTGQALASEISVSVDERTNSLIVAGREEAVALVEVLIADLDSDRDSRWVEPAIIQLAHADAASLAETLRDVLVNAESTTPEAEALRRQVGRLRIAMSGDGAPAAESDVYVPLGSLVIRAEENANALLVVGSPANLSLVRELVGMLDVEAAAAGNVVRVYPLEHAAAERVAGLASEVFRQREEAGAIRRQDRLTVAPDTRTNALIVSTSTRGFAIFETLLRTLDAEDANFSVGLHVLPVENADAGRLAPRIERLMRERIDASRRAGSVELPTDALRIEADEANNLLIVAASDENLAVIEELLDAMTRGDATGAELTELITVRSGRAEEVARTVRELYADRENERRGDRSVSVVANDRLNAVIISGEAGDIDAARRLIEDLESAQVTALQDVRRIELQAANALEVVNLIRTVLAGRPITGARGGNDTQATRLRFFRRQLESELETELGGMAGEAELDEAIRGQVRLTPDLRTNSVVFAAPPAVLELIEAIIDDLDTTTAGSRKIEIFELVNADARAMSVVLRDLFNLSQQGERFVLIPTQTSIETSGDTLSLGETTLTPVPDERQELSITIDARTNTLLVSGTAEYLDLVREVVEGLDDIEANERESFVYHLQNAKADEAEGTLQNYFESEARRVRELLGPDQAGSALRQLEQEVTVVGDVASNKLVVSASPRYVEAVERIIGELDAAPPQVMIQVLLAEVTLDEDDTWGADFEVGPLGGQAYQVATSAASGGLATAIGTPNLSVTTADFSLLVRALEVQGKLEVLSRPQVTVNNNEPAFIQVGEDVAIVSGVERLESGNTRSDVERRDVGIILNVTPSISNDGFVRMEISPEISTVTTRTTQISEDFEAPIISQRRIETTVTVQDGETVVIGGLIQTTDEERVSKVPLLGDIPILGVPFRATQRSRVKTELLVILTPVVIPGDSAEGLRAFRVRTEQSIDEMWEPGRIREAVRGAPSPALERPLPLEPVGATRDERELWDSGDDSLFPRSRRNGASP